MHKLMVHFCDISFKMAILNYIFISQILFYLSTGQSEPWMTMPIVNLHILK